VRILEVSDSATVDVREIITLCTASVNFLASVDRAGSTTEVIYQAKIRVTNKVTAIISAEVTGCVADDVNVT